MTNCPYQRLASPWEKVKSLLRVDEYGYLVPTNKPATLYLNVNGRMGDNDAGENGEDALIAIDLQNGEICIEWFYKPKTGVWTGQWITTGKLYRGNCLPPQEVK